MVDTERAFSLVKGGFTIYVIITMLIGIVLGIGIFIKTGDIKPLADDTIGVLLSGDNKAFELEKALEAKEFDTFEEPYKTMVIDSAIRTILSSIVTVVVFSFLIYKFVRRLFEWKEQALGTMYIILEIISTILVVGLLGLIYNGFSMYLGGESILENFQKFLLGGVPYKSIFYGIKMLVGVI